MKIHKIAVGYLKANCYVLEKKGQLIVIDPGDEYDKISKIIKDKATLPFGKKTLLSSNREVWAKQAPTPLSIKR